MTLLFAALAAEAASAVTGVALARRRPEHWPAALALLLLAGLALARVPTYGRADRWVAYLDGSIVLAEVAVPMALALAVALPGRKRLVAGVVTLSWLAGSAVLAALYPSPLVRGASLERIYLTADFVALAVAALALVSVMHGRRSLGSSGAVALALFALDLGILLVPASPWRERTWVLGGRVDVVQVGFIVFFAAIGAAQGIAWHFSSPSQPS